MQRPLLSVSILLVRVSVLHKLDVICLLISQSLLRDDVFSPFWGIKIDGQLYALGLVDSQRQIRLLLEILQSEAFKIFLC